MAKMTNLNRAVTRVIAGSLALLLVLGVSLTVASKQAHSAESALLPNLVADPPDNIHLETTTTDGGLKPAEEARLLLRFNGYIHNLGPGAVDIRGSREKPKETKKSEEQVTHAREKQEGLPQKLEEELALPPMNAFQRVFTTNAEETNSERPHKEEPSSAELIYSARRGTSCGTRPGPPKWRRRRRSASASMTASTSNPRLDRKPRCTPTASPRIATSVRSITPTPPACSRASPQAGATSTAGTWACSGSMPHTSCPGNTGCARK
jgi:hypothetical protein